MKNESQNQRKEMSEEAKIARREYYKAWAAKNRERVRESQRAFWERKAAKMQEGEPAK